MKGLLGFFRFEKLKHFFPRYVHSKESFPLVLPCPEATHSIADLQSDEGFGLAEASSWVQGELAASGSVTDTVCNLIYVIWSLPCFLPVTICNYTKCSGGFRWRILERQRIVLMY